MSYKFLSTIQAISATFTGNSVYSNSTPNRTTKLDAIGLYLSRTSDGGYVSTITADGSITYNTRNNHIFQGDSSTKLTIVQASGNVLIGTTTDGSYKLDVNGTGRFTGTTNQITAYYDASNYMQLQHNSISVANTALLFNVNSAERMRLLSTGNVLIGTTTDAGYKLDVNGTTRSQGKLTITTGGAEITGTAVLYSGAQSYGQVQIFSAAAFQMFNAANNSKASFQYINANGLLLTTNSDNISGVLKGLQVNPTMVASANNDVLVGLDITPTFTNGAFTGVSNLGLRVNSGNVSFGQNSTPSTLYINGGYNVASNDIYLINGYGTNNVSFGTGTKQWLLLGRGALPQTSAIAGINLGNNQYESGLLFATASGGVFSEKMRIWNTGNITINSTTDAGYKLDVNGTGRFSANLLVNGTNVPLSLTGSGTSNFSMNSNADVYFYFNSQSAVGRFYANPQGTVQNTYDQPSSVGFVGTFGGGDVWYGTMNPNGGTVKYNCSRNGTSHSHIWYYNFAEQMRLAYTGNLLIGTSTDAGYKLDVNGTARINSTLSLTNSTYAGTFSFYLSAANTLIASSANIGTWLQVGGGNNVYIVGQAFNSTARGNLFGNTVGGEAISATTIIAQSSGTAATTGLSLRYTINNTGTYVGISRGIYYNPTITSLTGTTHRAIETVVGDVIFGSTSGNVGIGTTTPAYKLDVTGTTKISSLGGGGTQMVVADNTGVLSTQAIPTPTNKSFGAFQEDTTQTVASSNVGYGIKFSIPDISGHGVTMINDPFGDPTYIEMTNAGFYNIQFSLQLQNTDGQIKDVTIWIRKNGNATSDDIPGSAGFVSVPNSHGGTPGTIIAAWNYFVEAAAGDFFQLVWSTTDHTRVSMEFYPAGSPPPSAASAILTVNQVN